MAKKTYYITTAIAYASGKPHIGNTYEIVLADSIARYKRFTGYDVRFQTGTDEHGQKIETKAFENFSTPKEFVDEQSGEIKRIWDIMNTSYDKFIRTTDEYHEVQIQKIFKKLYDQGDIYKSEYEGLYCTPCESFWTESQLVDGCCPDCGRPVKPAKEEAYFFKMSKYADRLIKYIEDHPDFIQPESRKNEMVNTFLKPGLQDLCVSRTSFKWGIPVDFDTKHVVYVWIDALSNYITGLGYDVDGNHNELYNKYWPADLHLIGKDILRFHTIYWPIMLMALDIPLPKQVFGHPWLNMSGGKMSKSKGNVLYADDMVDFFGVDAVRYFVLHETPFDNDGVVSWELLIERVNSDLANTLGNLVHRTVSMVNKYFGGVVTDGGINIDPDDEYKKFILDTRLKVNDAMDKLRVADAITEIWNLFKRCNKYIDETMPWALAKEGDMEDRLKTVLYNLVEGITIGASLLSSFLPETSEKILAQLNTEMRKVTELGTFGLYPNGNKVAEKPEMLFARIDVEKKLAEINEKFPVKEEEPEVVEKEKTPEKTEIPSVETAIKETISIDDFDKLQLQMGEVLKCEEVPGSKKLICSQVKVAGRTLQIVSGIKKFYKPEDMVGRKVVVITNLKPTKLAGVLSEGMLLCAEDFDGNLALLTADKDMPAGSMIS
ncbi:MULTISPECIES: methionine--tRNA ligase [Eubacterium]|uniref:Methionine--tRNA ligase n=1 Tax=Eubacterium ruminantium TaxID=42322 RepID=A0A1T4L3M4_9FIRM|nr:MULTISPECIES: methionine--tRNA ligase [Eubacterium]MCR5368154.1 methionine--tRNA ligase [Eubacterium sp.]SCW43105.1 methionyl-tRNA synthetase [Eubacterium ruminantium]SDM81293.1 methionyl-tRNA synthetase [Eubacterium ruminantium]SJZ49253.1 methionyl-tRNA synthetase [Eubacterium ruminantium]